MGLRHLFHLTQEALYFYGLFQDPEKMLRRETINPTEKVYFIIKFFIICKKRWFCTEITETLVRNLTAYLLMETIMSDNFHLVVI
jgi:hypothetical protein